MSTTSLAITRPLGWLLAASISFYIGVQLSGLARRAAAILLILIVFGFLASGPQVLALLPCSAIFVPLFHGITLHAIGILLSREPNLQVRTVPRLQRIRPIIHLLTDLRGLQPNGASAFAKEDDDQKDGDKKDGEKEKGDQKDGDQENGDQKDGDEEHGDQKHGETDRLSFAIRKSIHAVALWLLNYVITEVALIRLLQFLEFTLDDVAPDKQSFLPSMDTSDLMFRAILSTQWIWSTYCLMTAAHDLCAVLFVSILGWNSASDWPPLYGSFSSAFSLRRFWGSFYQKLHVAPFEAFMPSSLGRLKGDSPQVVMSKNMLRSFWVFALSALCHARINWALYRQNTIIAEIRFWTINWAVCLLETVLARIMKDTWVDLRFRRQHWRLRRAVGYFFVWAFFMCTAPAWQYPLVHNYEA